MRRSSGSRTFMWCSTTLIMFLLADFCAVPTAGVSVQPRVEANGANTPGNLHGLGLSPTHRELQRLLQVNALAHNDFWSVVKNYFEKYGEYIGMSLPLLMLTILGMILIVADDKLILSKYTEAQPKEEEDYDGGSGPSSKYLSGTIGCPSSSIGASSGNEDCKNKQKELTAAHSLKSSSEPSSISSHPVKKYSEKKTTGVLGYIGVAWILMGLLFSFLANYSKAKDKQQTPIPQWIASSLFMVPSVVYSKPKDPQGDSYGRTTVYNDVIMALMLVAAAGMAGDDFGTPDEIAPMTDLGDTNDNSATSGETDTTSGNGDTTTGTNTPMANMAAGTGANLSPITGGNSNNV